MRKYTSTIFPCPTHLQHGAQEDASADLRSELLLDVQISRLGRAVLPVRESQHAFNTLSCRTKTHKHVKAAQNPPND